MKYVTALVVLLCATSALAQHWVGPMREVHSRFTGTPNTLIRWGDSISATSAFFSGLGGYQANVGPEAAPALNWLRTQETMWTWYGQDYGSKSGSQTSFALANNIAVAHGAPPTTRNIDYWLDLEKPEMAVILWGTNDANPTNGVSAAVYQANLTAIVQTAKAYGTIPIITTPPPRHGVDMVPYVDAVNAVALAEHVPVIDYYGEILARNPDPSWDGKLLYDAKPGDYGYDTYNVPTSISGDGIHPSNTYAFQSNFSAEALQKNGYNLRNYVTLLKAYEVYDLAVATTPEPASLSLLGLGALALLKRRKTQ